MRISDWSSDGCSSDLLATSSDRAVRRLGPAVWSWIQGFAHVVFYLVVLHAAYFLSMHYTLSFHRAIPEPNWFRLDRKSVACGKSVSVRVDLGGRRPTRTINT